MTDFLKILAIVLFALGAQVFMWSLAIMKFRELLRDLRGDGK